MNAKQTWDGFRSLLILIFGGTGGVGWVTDEMGVAIGGAFLAIGVAIYQVFSSRFFGLLKAVEDDPGSVAVVVKDSTIADALGPKVLAASDVKVVEK